MVPIIFKPIAYQFPHHKHARLGWMWKDGFGWWLGNSIDFKYSQTRRGHYKLFLIKITTCDVAPFSNHHTLNTKNDQHCPQMAMSAKHYQQTWLPTTMTWPRSCLCPTCSDQCWSELELLLPQPFWLEINSAMAPLRVTQRMTPTNAASPWSPMTTTAHNACWPPTMTMAHHNATTMQQCHVTNQMNAGKVDTMQQCVIWWWWHVTSSLSGCFQPPRSVNSHLAPHCWLSRCHVTVSNMATKWTMTAHQHHPQMMMSTQHHIQACTSATTIHQHPPQTERRAHHHHWWTVMSTTTIHQHPPQTAMSNHPQMASPPSTNGKEGLPVFALPPSL